MRRGVLQDGLHLDSQRNLVQSSFNSPESSRKGKWLQKGNQQTETHFPEKHTAFDQSLIPLSAVVKGGVPERYLALSVEVDVCGRRLIQPGGSGGAGEVVPVAVESVGTRQG